MDLRFADEDEEVMFKLSLQPELKRSTFLLVPILLAICVLTLPRQLFREVLRTDDAFTFSFDDPRTLRFGISILGLAVIPMAWMVSTLLNLRYQYFRIVNWESVSVFILTFANICIWFSDRASTSVIFGMQPEDVYENVQQNDFNGVAIRILLMDLLTTCVCLFVPIRVCFKWIPPAFAVFSVGVQMVFFSSTYSSIQKTVAILVLGAASAMSLRGAWRNEQAVRQSFIAQRLVGRKSREQRIMHAGASHLLDRLCDALVELGHDLYICEPSPRLEAMLLRHDSASIEGTNFLDYLASDEDRERLRKALVFADTVSCESSDFDQIGGMVQLSMRDTYGRVFAVYVYHTRIFHNDGACGHIVALAEVQEREPPAAPTSINATVEVQTVSPDAAHFSDACSSVFETLVPLVNDDPNEVSAWIDMNSEDLIITKYSIGFTIFGPISVGSSLSDMIVGDVRKFREWFKTVADQKMQECDNSELPPYRLRLQPLPDATVEFRTTCAPKILSKDSEDCHSNERLLCIVFSDVVCRTRRRSHTRPRQRAPSCGGKLTYHSLNHACEHSDGEDSGGLSCLEQPSVSSIEDVASKVMDYFTAKPAFRFMVYEAEDSGEVKLLDYSNTFGALFGPSLQLGYSMTKWFKKRDLQCFLGFVKNQMGKHEHAGGRASHAAEDTLHMSIYPPHLKPFKLRICASLTVRPALRKQDLSLFTDDDTDDADFPVLVVLENVEWKAKKSTGLPQGAASRLCNQASISL